MADFKIKGVRRRALRPRTLLTLLLAAALVLVVWLQRDTVASVFSAIARGAAVPLIFAVALEAVRIVLHAYAYTRSFRVIGARVPLSATVPAWFKAVFMNTVLPSGGTSGLAAVVDSARRYGVPVGSATSATLFTQTCYYLSMLAVIVVGFSVMAQSGTLQVRDVLLGCVMAVVAFAFLGLLAMGHFAPGVLQRALRRIERFVVAACRKMRLKKTPRPWADALVHSFSSAATELSRHPRRALLVLASMVAAMGFDMLAFAAAGLAFDIARPDALFGGYVTALVLNSFTVTPGGVGVVEGFASAVLAGYGYPLASAVSAVLVYRTIMYWGPFVIGGVMMHVTGAFGLGKQGSAEGGTDADVYLRRRRPSASPRERLVAFVNDTIELRTVVCAALLVLTAAFSLVDAALPPDPAMVEAIADRVFGHGALPSAFMVVFAYLILLFVPGILIHDQGNWLASIAALLCLGVSTALSGHSAWVMALVVCCLAALALWHACFDRHGFFKSLLRLVRVLVWGVCVAALYALAGALLVRGAMHPDPGLGGALWLGLQSLAAAPRMEGVELGPQALQFFASVGAVRIAFTAAAVYALCFMAIRRIVAWSRPQRRQARARARAQADAAAAERKAARRRHRDALLDEARARFEAWRARRGGRGN